MHHDHDLPTSARTAVKDQTLGILDNVRFLVRESKIRTFDDIREAIEDDPYDETAAVSVSVEDCVTLIECHAEDLGVERIDVHVRQLSQEIEATAAQIVCQLAVDEALELLEGLEELCDDHDFDASDLLPENQFAMFSHAGQEEPDDDCVVYKYRGIEGGEIDVDVWEYEFPGTDFKLYINQYVDDEG